LNLFKDNNFREIIKLTEIGLKFKLHKDFFNYIRALYYHRIENYEESLKYFLLDSCYKNYIDFIKLKSDCLYELKKFKEYLIESDILITHDKQNIVVLYRRFYCYLKLFDYINKSKTLNKILKIDINIIPLIGKYYENEKSLGFFEKIKIITKIKNTKCNTETEYYLKINFLFAYEEYDKVIELCEELINLGFDSEKYNILKNEIIKYKKNIKPSKILYLIILSYIIIILIKYYPNYL